MNLFQVISKKKEALLYKKVHERIMQARVEIISFLKENNLPYSEIDTIMSKTFASTPKIALRCFEKPLPIEFKSVNP
jgi:hypothetical protein